MTLNQRDAILSLLATDSDGFKPIEVQKLMFVYSREDAAVPLYDFVPFKKGGYSFSLAHDISSLGEEGLLVEMGTREVDRRVRITDSGMAYVVSRSKISREMVSFRRRYTLRDKKLVADVYKRYPYWASNSRILDFVIPNDEKSQEVIRNAKYGKVMGLATIGYEGKSPESYFNTLITRGVSVLCDVRKNPISRKYGFSKSVMMEICDGVGIEYRHYPNLGIPSFERKELVTQADYDELFGRYEKTILNKQVDDIAALASLVDSGEGVALTCFERNPAQCHRTRVARAVAAKLGITFEEY